MYVQRTNSNVYLQWRHDSIFLVKHRMFWISKSCTSSVLRRQSGRGIYSSINGLVFVKSFENNYKYFFINFSGLQQVFPIFKLLINTHREKLCFTQFSTRMTAWLFLTFFMRLHNQLNSIYSIITFLKSTDIWKMWFSK